jgi:uncharacterized protein
MDKLREIIQTLKLVPLAEEGGLYVQTYLSHESFPQQGLPDRYRGPRVFGSAIFFLLTDELDSFSAMHRVETDEIYHFYLGDPVELVLLSQDGTSRHVTLGQDILAGQQVQFVVQAGDWQGSRLIKGGHFALMGTTMAPGFNRADFSLGGREALLAGWPHEENGIRSLTRSSA